MNIMFALFIPRFRQHSCWVLNQGKEIPIFGWPLVVRQYYISCSRSPFYCIADIFTITITLMHVNHACVLIHFLYMHHLFLNSTPHFPRDWVPQRLSSLGRLFSFVDWFIFIYASFFLHVGIWAGRLGLWELPGMDLVGCTGYRHLNRRHHPSNIVDIGEEAGIVDTGEEAGVHHDGGSDGVLLVSRPPLYLSLPLYLMSDLSLGISKNPLGQSVPR